MKLIANEPVSGFQTGQTFEVDGAEACRLITYGFASPADPGPVEASFGTSAKRPQPEDASLAAELRTRGLREDVNLQGADVGHAAEVMFDLLDFRQDRSAGAA